MSREFSYLDGTEWDRMGQDGMNVCGCVEVKVRRMEWKGDGYMDGYINRQILCILKSIQVEKGGWLDRGQIESL